MSWEEYTRRNQERPLRPFYTRAFQLLQQCSPELTGKSEGRVAIELGCGAGIETRDLLRHGWQVFAYDQEPSAIQMTESLLEPEFLRNLTATCTVFEKITSLPKNAFTFSYHSLPFCNVDHFDFLIELIINSIEPGGIFAASFFGHQDDWVRAGSTLGSDEAELRHHFRDFKILCLEERDEMGGTMFNGPKRWHTLELIAQKL